MLISPAAPASTALSDLLPGHSATVVALRTDDMALHQRLLALGLRIGRQVLVVRRAPFGGPLQLRIGATDILIRRADATPIRVALP
jgi:ferrous iron transport protein A